MEMKGMEKNGNERNGKEWKGNDLKGSGRGLTVRYYSGFRLQELRKITKTLG
jgi:hypothetical protein